MVVRGYVHNGVVVLADGVCLPEGQEVTVVTQASEKANGPYPASKERHEAALELIGILKTDQPPPTDEEVEQIVEEARMRKYG